MPSDWAIQTERAGRIYKVRGGKKDEAKTRVALTDVTLEIPRGEFFGLLGPNGAGKTYPDKESSPPLLAPTSGWAKVAGFDVLRQPDRVRPRINMVSGGESSGYGLLTVRENLWMFGQFYGMDTRTTNRRIDELLTIVGLKDRANTKSSDLSTGLRQKMNIVRGFLTDPEVIFLDEPTLGLDVGASREVRRFIRDWMTEKPEQRTLLLTDPLHGRGRRAVRPGGHHQRRQGAGLRYARQPQEAACRTTPSSISASARFRTGRWPPSRRCPASARPCIPRRTAARRWSWYWPVTTRSASVMATLTAHSGPHPQPGKARAYARRRVSSTSSATAWPKAEKTP
jgi:ABC-type Na+ transport system ATPase subunit NatA